MITTMNKWQTKDQLVGLLSKLVHFPSVTGSKAEIDIAEFIIQEIRSLPYFQQNPEYVKLNPTGDGRNFVTALVKKSANVRNTVILVSHFDVVDVQDYGKWKNLAFEARELTETYNRHKDEMPLEVQQDIEEGNWLFGRGTMDMKCGLALHMSMVEKACEGEFDGNILLLTVPDEEVNAVGMRAAAPVLLQLAEEFDLEYKTCLNSEPIFSRFPGDQNNYIYSGSIGKLLPGFYCYGKETHVGEPLSGLNSTLMASKIACELELNTELCEMVDGEVTPPPTSLFQKDLKKEYSVQIPDRSVILYNLFLMEKPMDKIVQQLRQLAEDAAARIEQYYTKKSARYVELEGSKPSSMKVNVLSFEQLFAHVIKIHGKEKIDNILSDLQRNRGEKDDRDLSIQMIDELGLLCKELSPMIVLFFAPPYCPAISSRNHPRIKQVVHEMISYAEKVHGIRLENQNYFPGISDLSYAGLQEPVSALRSLTTNMPLWEKGYTLPLEELAILNLPVMNLGPVGRDAHKWTERLDVNYAFGALFDMLPVVIHELLMEENPKEK